MRPPCVNRPLEPLCVQAGTTATFVVEFGGFPMPLVQWFRYSFPVHNSAKYYISTEDGR